MSNRLAAFNYYGGIFLFVLVAGVFVISGMITSIWSDSFKLGLVSAVHLKWVIWLLFITPLIIHIVGWFFLHQFRQKPENKKSLETTDPNELPEEKKEELGINTFCGFYNLTMLFSVFSYCIMWIAYNFESKSTKWLWFCGGICIVGVVLQFLIIAVVTYIVMETTPAEYLGPKTHRYCIFLKFGLERSPFWRFAHFFAIFMSITFLFGFAFAFHDQQYRKIENGNTFALQIENLASDEELEKKELENTTEPKPTPTPTPDNSKLIDNSDPVCFYFESNKSNLLANSKEPDGYFKDIKNENLQKEIVRTNENLKSLENLSKNIVDNKKQGIPRLILIGSADDKMISKNGNNKDKTNYYPSNYDLSEARIQTVKNELTKNIYKKNNKEWVDVDWITVAHSNEDYFNNVPNGKVENEIKKCSDLIFDKTNGTRVNTKSPQTKDDPDSRKRSVAVYFSIAAREPENLSSTNKPPNLMDYMYFSIYTITTTGYGDIKPATRYAKFLVSLENFFEVFFLVCFMNSLIALKSDSKPLEKKKENNEKAEEEKRESENQL